MTREAGHRDDQGSSTVATIRPHLHARFKAIGWWHLKIEKNDSRAHRFTQAQRLAASAVRTARDAGTCRPVLNSRYLHNAEVSGIICRVQPLTEKLIEHGLRNRTLNERQLERAIGGPAARRYGLVNRALKAEELVRVRRGLYVLAAKFRTEPVHPFAIAQAIEPGSYVSLETALGFHGWIPEGVRVTASIVPGRKSAQLDHAWLGGFTFHPLALYREHLLELVERRQFDHQTALVARPLRALMDLVALRKLEWRGRAWLSTGMRIDTNSLQRITRKEIRTLGAVYKQQRPNQFLTGLAQELDLD